MSVYVIQDKYHDPLTYIVSAGSMRSAVQLRLELEDIDRSDNVYEPDKYRIEKREYCYSDYSGKCGAGYKGVCMLPDPEKDCPAIRTTPGAKTVTKDRRTNDEQTGVSSNSYCEIL